MQIAIHSVDVDKVVAVLNEGACRAEVLARDGHEDGTVGTRDKLRCENLRCWKKSIEVSLRTVIGKCWSVQRSDAITKGNLQDRIFTDSGTDGATDVVGIHYRTLARDNTSGPVESDGFGIRIDGTKNAKVGAHDVDDTSSGRKGVVDRIQDSWRG